MRVLRMLPALVVISAAGLWLATTATSADPQFRSKVTIHFDNANQDFFGKVRSPRAQCEPRRRVILYRENPMDADPVKSGRDRTNAQGEWRIHQDMISSPTYFARVTPHRINAGTCGDDRSKRFTFVW